ncbi:hypothetical protein QYE76_013610 [Lolium multiflorum]|uniref:Uncharacterized protein n=1 Tax=Lolium multiflorum TaxID=4521 RepID=A0AAD8U3B2_LOLMU|nr:hypothetical protein QYE76_013610 [Lolium multiflorum]
MRCVVVTEGAVLDICLLVPCGVPGKIWRLVAEAKDAKLAHLKLHGTPGGAPAFGLAAKFCYNVHVDVTVANLANLRCAARYLQMTDDFSDKNLELCAEAFDVNLVARLIAAIANNVCKEQLASRLLSRLDQSRQLKPQTVGLVELHSPGGGLLGKSVAVLGLQTMAMSSALDFQRWLDVHGLLRGR